MDNKTSTPCCPRCNSENVMKNGFIHNGKLNYQCKDCTRQFVLNPKNKKINRETKDLIDKLLLERLALAAIARVAGVSERWLQKYVNEKFENIEKEVDVEEKEKGPLRIECDEMWSFVGHKGNKVWIWLAIDRTTREIVGVYIGSRDKKGASRFVGFFASDI